MLSGINKIYKMKKKYFEITRVILEYAAILLIVIFLTIDAFSQKGSEDKFIRIFMVGNSTMADKSYKDGNPEKGWGQIFPLYFRDSVKVKNFAVNGRSTKSFINEGKWDAVVELTKPGDYVIIEFGHNDEKKNDPKRYTNPHTDYRNNLIKFVKDTRSKGGIPILATPIVRRRFDDKGNFYDTHGDYPEVIREVAKELDVPLLDLQKDTEQLLKEFGEEKSKCLFLHIEPFEYKSLPEGRSDDTHLSAYGAFKVCDLAAEEIRTSIKDLAKWLKK
jgi:lysophospholipase L1-like esterase